MKKFVCLLSMLTILSCQKRIYKLEVTFNNGDKDTMQTKTVTSEPRINDGDLSVQGHSIMASGVRSFKIIKIENQ